jgi:hypothetical protein
MAGGVTANYIAKWNGSSWSALGSGTNNTVYAIAVDRTDVYAGGSFSTAGGVTTNGIAKWNGASWSNMGGGMDGYVYTIAVNGNTVYAGGSFTTVDNSLVDNIAKWDTGMAPGRTWAGRDERQYQL